MIAKITNLESGIALRDFLRVIGIAGLGLQIGSYHMTNDLSLGLPLPMARAERLKIEEGSVSLGQSMPGGRIVLKDATGLSGKEVESETLNTIIHYRVRETFELMKARLETSGARLDQLGAGLHSRSWPSRSLAAGAFIFVPYTGASKKDGVKTGRVEIFRTSDGSALGHVEPRVRKSARSACKTSAKRSPPTAGPTANMWCCSKTTTSRRS